MCMKNFLSWFLKKKSKERHLSRKLIKLIKEIYTRVFQQDRWSKIYFFVFLQHPYLFALRWSLSSVSWYPIERDHRLSSYGPFRFECTVMFHDTATPSRIATYTHSRLYHAIVTSRLYFRVTVGYSTRMSVSEKPSSSSNFHFLILAIVSDSFPVHFLILSGLSILQVAPGDFSQTTVESHNERESRGNCALNNQESSRLQSPYLLRLDF